MTGDAFFDAVRDSKSDGAFHPEKGWHPIVQRSASQQRRLTAAATRGSLLAVATLERTETGLRLVPRQAGFYELEGRDQVDLRRFSRDLSRSLVAWGVRDLLLRSSPDAGPYLAKPSVYKVEAVLQMLGMLGVNLVQSQAVSGWVNRTDTEIPAPDAIGGKRFLDGQRSAIETAAYGLRLDKQ